LEWDWVHLVRQPIVGLLYLHRIIEEYEEFDGMRIGRGNRSTRRKPAPLPLCPSQIPHYLNQAASVGSRRLTAWAMAWSDALCRYTLCNGLISHQRNPSELFPNSLWWSLIHWSAVMLDTSHCLRIFDPMAINPSK
jgi:hypothetical protein